MASADDAALQRAPGLDGRDGHAAALPVVQAEAELISMAPLSPQLPGPTLDASLAPETSPEHTSSPVDHSSDAAPSTYLVPDPPKPDPTPEIQPDLSCVPTPDPTPDSSPGPAPTLDSRHTSFPAAHTAEPLDQGQELQSQRPTSIGPMVSQPVPSPLTSPSPLHSHPHTLPLMMPPPT